MSVADNISISQHLVEGLSAAGICKVVVCAGSFNSALVSALNLYAGIEKIFHFEERSAAFFAMGWSKNCSEPVAVCITSGTAVAECLPAVIEAFYNNTQLVIISADRSESLSGTGFPQAISQNKILSEYCLQTYDIQSLSEIENMAQLPSGPVHINIRFSEPILDKNILAETLPAKSKKVETRNLTEVIVAHNKNITDLSSLLKNYSRPLFVVDKIPFAKSEEVSNFLMLTGAPILTEARSGLRESEQLSRLILKGTEKVLKGCEFDSIIRIGNVPTFNLWRSLERDPNLASVPVISISQNKLLTGLSRNSISLDFQDCSFENALTQIDNSWANTIFSKDKNTAATIEELLNEYPLSEAAFVRAYSLQTSKNSLIYLGNSLPIREWNEFASYSSNYSLIDANRGANGIDGQIASFFGAVKSNNAQHYYALLGDLTFLYDCNSLTLASRLEQQNYCIAVINNSGGQIFRRLDYFEKLNPETKQQNDFVNQHTLSIAKIAQSFGLNSISLNKPEFPASLNGIQLIELLPEAEQSDEFNRRLSRYFDTN